MSWAVQACVDSVIVHLKPSPMLIALAQVTLTATTLTGGF